jgi:hypothetical protein
VRDQPDDDQLLPHGTSAFDEAGLNRWMRRARRRPIKIGVTKMNKTFGFGLTLASTLAVVNVAHSEPPHRHSHRNAPTHRLAIPTNRFGCVDEAQLRTRFRFCIIPTRYDVCGICWNE